MSYPPSKPPIAFIGLGAMGFAMSTHLVRTGFTVTGYDVYEPTLERWRNACAEIPTSSYQAASSPSEAAKSAPITLLMVATHHHVNSALFDDNGAVHSLPQNATVIIAATVPPTHPAEVRQRLDNDFNRADVKLIDAPVSGGTARSVNGTLTIMSSSNDPDNLKDESVHAVLSNLASQGKTLYTIPGSLGSGTSAKALNQVQCGIHITCTSEMMGLAAVLGLNTRKFFEYLTTPEKENEGWSWMFANRAPRMLVSDPPMSSATSIINKDVGIILAEEKRLDVQLPLLDKASEVLKYAMENGLASADDSAVVKVYLGLKTPKEELVVQQVRADKDDKDMFATLATAHVLVHFNSSYETVKFADALDLMGSAQRDMWFDILAGAAAGSYTFTRVVPVAFADKDGWQAGFKGYAKENFAGKTDGVRQLVEQARKEGYESKLVEAALEFVEGMVKG